MLTESQLREVFRLTNTGEPLAESWHGLEQYGRLVEKLTMDQFRVQKADTVTAKPAISVISEKIWKETRIFTLMECMVRRHSERSCSEEQYGVWLDELRRLLNDVLYDANNMYERQCRP